MKNLFYREQEAHQVLELDYKELAFECEKHMELRIASDDWWIAKIAPPVDRLREAPSRLATYVKHMARLIPK
jgi:hypothetical protein